ncbi:MAG: caspase family protein [Polyangiaceae bacterium]|nr:caspase family protein [Polyangiaceae bacterium]
MGVNVGPGARVLNYAENDALRFARVMVGDLGPVAPQQLQLLQGGAATRRSVLAAIASLERQPPDCLVMSFSGHGSPQGILLSDGLLPYTVLGAALRRVPSRIKTIFLDACHAGAAIPILRDKVATVAGVGGWFEPAWQFALAAACDGLRVFAAVSPDTNAYEDHERRSGRFTFAVTQALSEAPAGVCLNGLCWTTDDTVFDSAADILNTLWSGESGPELLLPTGCGSPLPLTLAQSEHVIGGAEVRGLAIQSTGVGVQVTTSTTNRRFIRTYQRATLLDGWGLELGSTCCWYEPIESAGARTTVLTLHPDVLTEDLARRNRLALGLQESVTWRVEIVDAFGRVLDCCEAPAVYWRQNPRRAVGW